MKKISRVLLATLILTQMNIWPKQTFAKEGKYSSERKHYSTQDALQDIMEAIKRNDFTTLRYFYDSNPKDFAKTTKTGYKFSPLMFAVFYGIDNSADLLLAFPEVRNSINTLKDINGRTVIYMAIDKQNAPMLEKLLRFGANPNVKDAHGVTPLKAAMYTKNQDLVEIIKRKLAEK